MIIGHKCNMTKLWASMLKNETYFVIYYSLLHSSATNRKTMPNALKTMNDLKKTHIKEGIFQRLSGSARQGRSFPRSPPCKIIG
jgi:hypothetical protein